MKLSEQSPQCSLCPSRAGPSLFPAFFNPLLDWKLESETIFFLSVTESHQGQSNSWWVPQFFLSCFPFHIPFSHLIFPLMKKVSAKWCDKTRHFLFLILSSCRSETCLILSRFDLQLTQVSPIPSSHQPRAHLSSSHPPPYFGRGNKPPFQLIRFGLLNIFWAVFPAEVAF